MPRLGNFQLVPLRLLSVCGIIARAHFLSGWAAWDTVPSTTQQMATLDDDIVKVTREALPNSLKRPHII